MKDENQETKSEGKTDYEMIIQVVIITVLAMLLIYNGTKIFGNENSLTGVATGIGSVSASEIIPKGIPEIYGKELSVSYDDVSPNNPQLADATIRKLTAYENKNLSADLMKRYINIGNSIACEYCCGANALVFPNGQPACGCQHSAAMRGLAMYLLINHPDMTDVQILAEMGKWKTLFFPKQVLSKAISFASAGLDSNINTIDLTSEKFRDFKASAISTSSGSPASSGSIDTSGWSEDEKMNYEMHGIIPARVQQSTSSGSAGGVLANAPDMVGGC